MTSKTSRREFISLSAAVLGGTLVAACQPQEIERVVEVEKEVTSVVEVEKEVERVIEPRVIRVTHRTGIECENWSYFAQKFNDEHLPDVSVKMECTPGGDYFVKLNTQIAGGTLPDVVWISSIEGFYRMAASGAFAGLDEMVQYHDLDLDVFYPECVEAARVGGTLYGLPQVAHPGRVGLFYHKGLFDDAGMDYPDDSWTYDDLVTAASQLTNLDEGVWGFIPCTDYFCQVVYARSWGGDTISEDGTQCTIDSPETVAALEYLADLFHEYHVAPMPGEESLGTYQLLAADKVAMYQSGFWGRDALMQIPDPEILGSAPMPIGPAGVRGSMFESDPVCIAANSKLLEESFQFISTIVSYESQMRYNQETLRSTSPRIDVMESEAAQRDPTFQVFAPIMREAMPLVLPANYRETEYFKLIGDEFAAVWLGMASVTDVLDDIKSGAQEILDKEPLA